MPLPADSGRYEIRMFSHNGYTRLGQTQIVVSSPTPVASVSVTVSPQTVSAGSGVNIEWRGIASASSTDWIGLYRPGDPDTAPLAWLHVGCAQEPLDARPLGSCNLLLPNTLGSGDFELRLFGGNAYRPLVGPVSLRVSEG